jgi:hypothetical protein
MQTGGISTETCEAGEDDGADPEGHSRYHSTDHVECNFPAFCR